MRFVLRNTLVVATLGVLACSEPPPLSLRAPAPIVHALSQLSDLGAAAELVAKGQDPSSGVDLERGDDGVSFSGFVAAEPGDYTLEVVFSGVVPGSASRVFLGRYVSDAFTVARGQSVSAAFSRPLDTIGRPDDHGDDDGDGLGMLDEVLWGTSDSSDDSDDDGLADGVDCDPADPGRAFTIVAGGSHEDCDGDGVRRIDLPWAGAGEDCDDKDPAVQPGAEDDCGDGVDQDCSDATCPSDVRDTTPPAISAVTPTGGSAVGCHATFAATIEDDVAVASASLAFIDCPLAQGERVLHLQRDLTDDSLWTSGPVNVAAGSGFPASCRDGSQRVELRAVDSSSNRATLRRSVTLDFAIPELTAMTPAEIGLRDQPFSIEVTASASSGVAGIELRSAPRGTLGFALDQASSLGSASSSPGSFSVDPAGFADGEYLLYPVVVDSVGNALQPSAAVLSDGLMRGDYGCIAGGYEFLVPGRVLVVGTSQAAPASMRDHLNAAIAAAAAEDPDAVMVSAKAFGLGADGAVDLSDGSSYMKRWEYGFFNATSRVWITVSWYTPAYATENPVVNANAGNVVEEDPLADPAALVDSDVAAAAMAASSGCSAASGSDDDYIIYDVIDGAAVVSVGNNSTGQFWRGAATDPVGTLIGCE